MAITKEQLKHWFSYHVPQPGQKEKLEAVRAAGLAFAEAIVANSPPSADQTAAVRKVREAVMTTNAAIVCDGR